MTEPYASNAHHVFSRGLGSPIPVQEGQKHPPVLGTTGANAPQLSGADVEEYRSMYPDANIAIRFAPDVVGLDHDYHAGHTAVAEARAELEVAGGRLEPTWRTTRRGAGDSSGIYLYRLPEGADEADLRDPRAAQGHEASHIETIRASHRYGMTVGSIVDGDVYRVIAPDGTVQGELPHHDQLPFLTWGHVGYLRKPLPSQAPAPESQPEPDDLSDSQRNFHIAGLEAELGRLDRMSAKARPNGSGYDGEPWNNTLFAVACNAIEIANTLGLEVEEIIEQVRTRAPRDSGFADAEVEKRISQARSRVGSNKRPSPPPRDADPFGGAAAGGGDPQAAPEVSALDRMAGRTWKDSDVALAFVEHHPSLFRYVEKLGWHMWNGVHWRHTSEGAILGLSDSFAREMSMQAARRGDPALSKAASARMDNSKIRSTVAVARNRVEVRTEPESLDRDPNQLNCANGTLDLSGDEPVLRPHDPNDIITKACGAAYNPHADRTIWEGFLKQVLPDADERAFLQRVIGTALVGDVSEHIFPILIGEGRNGKGTFYEAVKKAMGSYAIIIDPKMLMSSPRDGVGGEEMMSLMGARLAIGSETNEGRSLDEAVMKRLTGGDGIRARKLYEPEIEWAPTHQLIYVTNHLPKVKGDDEGTWSRMKVIPFDVIIPRAERDTQLPKRLAQNLDAVLAWAVEGYFDWKHNGLQEPETVQVATQQYRHDHSPVERFLEEDCLLSPAATARTSEIFEAWARWAARNHEGGITDKALSHKLERLGYVKKKTNRGAVWQGVSPLVTLAQELA